MSRFEIENTPIAGVQVIDRRRLGDARGFLERIYCPTELASIGVEPIRQINRTLTENPGTLRGLHLQFPPAAEVKLVSCLRGQVFDVALDLRTGSDTYGQWFGLTLSGDGTQSLLIPKGCAHGFQTLTPDCEMLYLHSQDYAPDHEGGVHPTSAGVDWPLEVSEMSDRDAALPPLKDFEGTRP